MHPWLSSYQQRQIRQIACGFSHFVVKKGYGPGGRQNGSIEWRAELHYFDLNEKKVRYMIVKTAPGNTEQTQPSNTFLIELRELQELLGHEQDQGNKNPFYAELFTPKDPRRQEVSFEISKQLSGEDKTRRTYLQVPYAEKDEASKLGAIWDSETRKWYVPHWKDPEDFRWHKIANPHL